MPPAFEATLSFVPQASPASGHRASRFAKWVACLFEPVRGERPEALDRTTGLYNRIGLFAAAEKALRRNPGATGCVIVIDFADLQEVRNIYGAACARQVGAKIIRKLHAIAGMRGLVGRTGSAQFTLVLPGTSHDKAVRRVERTLGKTALVEFDAGDSEIVLVPHVVVDTLLAGAESAQSVYAALCGELSGVRKGERRRMVYLATERERHSRPMTFPPR